MLTKRWRAERFEEGAGQTPDRGRAPLATAPQSATRSAPRAIEMPEVERDWARLEGLERAFPAEKTDA
jgi:hypothetical protein